MFFTYWAISIVFPFHLFETIVAHEEMKTRLEDDVSGVYTANCTFIVIRNHIADFVKSIPLLYIALRFVFFVVTSQRTRQIEGADQEGNDNKHQINLLVHQRTSDLLD